MSSNKQTTPKRNLTHKAVKHRVPGVPVYIEIQFFQTHLALLHDALFDEDVLWCELNSISRDIEIVFEDAETIKSGLTLSDEFFEKIVHDEHETIDVVHVSPVHTRNVLPSQSLIHFFGFHTVPLIRASSE